MMNSATAGFKYFDCRGIRRVKIKVRGYCKGDFQVKTAWDGAVLGTIPVDFTNIWKEYAAEITIPDGKQALYFVFTGEGTAGLCSFTLE
jgi:arabinoxylan arabinofuranohydrolase